MRREQSGKQRRKRKFGSRPNIIGQRLILDDVGRTIVGVLPSSFHFRIHNFQRGDPQIIGIVGKINQWGLDSDGPMALQIYLPLLQIPDKEM
jgi:hypothetical protein